MKKRANKLVVTIQIILIFIFGYIVYAILSPFMTEFVQLMAVMLLVVGIIGFIGYQLFK